MPEYVTYPAGASAAGAEIIGPVRQNGSDVTLTVTQLMAPAVAQIGTVAATLLPLAGGTMSGGLIIGPITNPDTQYGGTLNISANLTQNRSGNNPGYSLIVSRATFAADSALQFDPALQSFNAAVETYNVPGYTYSVQTLGMVKGPPPGVTQSALSAAYSGTALLPAVECCNPTINNSGLDLPSSVTNADAAYEIDYQLAGGTDDAAIRCAYAVNLAPTPVAGWNGAAAGTAEGTPTMAYGFKAIGLAPGAIASGYAVAGNVGIGLTTREVPSSIVMAITAAPTVKGPGTPSDWPSPAAAPAAIGSGAVIHIGPPTSGGSAFSTNAAFAHGTSGATKTGPYNLLPFTLNGNTYHAAGIQPDGPGYGGCYIQTIEPLVSGDGTVGQVVTLPVFGLLMNAFHRVGWEPTGVGNSYWDPSQFSSQGALVTTGNGIFNGSLSIGAGQALAGSPVIEYLTYSPRDGGHVMQWQPYHSATEFLQNGTIEFSFSAATVTGPNGFTSGTLPISDANGNHIISAGLLNGNGKKTALSSATATYTMGTENTAVLTYTGTITSLTVTMPTPAAAGDTRRLSVSQPVTTFVLKRADGTTQTGFPSSFAQPSSIQIIWDATDSTWNLG